MLLNDDKLILQIQHGNTACANELVERYYSSILRIPQFFAIALGIAIIQTVQRI